MIKPYTNFNTNKVVYITPNSQTNNRSRALAVLCLINSKAVALISCYFLARCQIQQDSATYRNMSQRISTKTVQN